MGAQFAASLLPAGPSHGLRRHGFGRRAGALPCQISLLRIKQAYNVRPHGFRGCSS
ncbi:hypothetical protein [Propionispora sp. 2/2-37]|uniref:hypothetical protein n=1 Tax=Propionispora sp. 2/2-37 TaxID=1677858 RepID=UPI0012E0EF34|nr:hypothetical protein [Propionispora sp. 2/2-37]